MLSARLQPGYERRRESWRERAPERACVITGVGMISPLGADIPATRQSLRAGHSGIVPISRFAADGFPVRCAGEVAAEGLEDGGRRAEVMAEIALAEAFASAQLPWPALPRPASGGADPRRALSFALGKPTLNLERIAELRRRAGTTDPAALLGRFPELEAERADREPSAILPRLAAKADVGGELFSSYTACASGNDAIGLGLRLIERGEADLVVTGASDTQVHPLSLIEFELLSALSHEDAERACRPFDHARTGFVVGEGAAAMILESAEHARRRGVPVRARLAGYGASLDSFGLTKCHPQGRGATLAMQAALEDAGMSAAEIDYLNAHGTGTVLNDQAEAAAIQQIWGDDTGRLPVSSTKSLTGHLLTAASAAEAVIALLCLEDGLLPVNRNFERPDPGCRLNIVAGASRPARLRAVMSNGFGFGGQNASLILCRTEDDRGGDSPQARTGARVSP